MRNDFFGEISDDDFMPDNRAGKVGPVPAGYDSRYTAEGHIGVDRSPFYTLVAEEGSGVTIDDDGNAVATNAGTYSVTAKIKPGYEWIIGNDDPATAEYESRTTTDDQTITFTIQKKEILMNRCRIKAA